jgi:hypothetical protein
MLGACQVGSMVERVVRAVKTVVAVMGAAELGEEAAAVRKEAVTARGGAGGGGMWGGGGGLGEGATGVVGQGEPLWWCAKTSSCSSTKSTRIG